MTVRDSTKAKRAKKEKAAIASLSPIKVGVKYARDELKSGDLVPFVIQAAEEGNVESADKLMEWFIEAFVKGEDPHPLLQGYFAFCFAKIRGGINPHEALNLKHKKNSRPTTAKRDADIVALVEWLTSENRKPLPVLIKKEAMAKAAETYFGDYDASSAFDRVKNILTKNKKSRLSKVKN